MASTGQSKGRRVHVGPEAVSAPALLEEVPLLIRLEREVLEEFRPQLLARLQEKVDAVDASLSGTAPRCDDCGGRAMKSRGRKGNPQSFRTQFGDITVHPAVYRCPDCKIYRRPLLEKLGTEAGRISGSLARLLALLGVVVPYQLAARLVLLFFGIEVSAMAVWRAVQRLGAPCEEYTEEMARYHAHPHSDDSEPAETPAVVLAGTDGCALGMQVREHRRRRKSEDEVLPPLEAVEEGHFREVKSGVLLLPSERVEVSPGRRSVLRRILVACLGTADEVYDRLWSALQELGWLGKTTVVVLVGDGAEWIWNRAEMFVNRCEILDFWHAIEHAWKFARMHFGENSKAAASWVSRLKKDLLAGRVEKVIGRLQQLQTSSPEEQEELESLIRYYTTNTSRMRYDEYLRLGYGIGSGAAESVHKQLVHARMRQAGMRWSEAGARHLLALRLLLLNDEWSSLDRLMMKQVAA